MLISAVECGTTVWMKGFLSLSYSVAIGFNIWAKILLSASIDELVSLTCEIWQKTDGDGSWTETLRVQSSRGTSWRERRINTRAVVRSCLGAGLLLVGQCDLKIIHLEYVRS